MSAETMKKYISEGIRALERMEESSRKGNSVSTETLMRLVRETENTEYGRKYGFAGIRSHEDYAGKVPLSGYADY